MSELSVDAATLCEVFRRTAERHPERLALTTTDGSGPDITWGEMRRRGERLAAGLMERGVQRGETVASMTANRPEFFLVELAVLIAGGTPLAMYNTSPPEELAYILDDARPRVVFTEPDFEPALQRGLALADASPEVVIIGDPGDSGLEAFERGCPEDVDVEDAWGAVRREDIAIIIYTSGTTGRPKGVQISHRNMMAAWEMFAGAEPRMGRQERVISYLPIAHLADRLFSQYAAMYTGATIYCVIDRRQIGAALAMARPSGFLGVPRIWEKLRSALYEQVGPSPDADTARAVREKIGLDENTVLWTGSAPLDVEVLDFFDSIGLAVLEGYGMTETAAVICLNPREDRRHGTVGLPAPGLELKIADDGEILVRGDNVMVGYRNLPEQTAEAIDSEGWLHTGDVGTLDDDGYLTIIDRKKELLITSGGKNIAPTQIENALRSASHLLGPVAAIGDRRPYITALLTLEPDGALAWAAAHGIAETDIAALAGDPQVVAEIERAVAEANTRLARVAQIKHFRLLPETWLPDDGVVTPTMKLKRKAIVARYADEIDALYA